MVPGNCLQERGQLPVLNYSCSNALQIGGECTPFDRGVYNINRLVIDAHVRSLKISSPIAGGKGGG